MISAQTSDPSPILALTRHIPGTCQAFCAMVRDKERVVLLNRTEGFGRYVCFDVPDLLREQIVRGAESVESALNYPRMDFFPEGLLLRGVWIDTNYVSGAD